MNNEHHLHVCSDASLCRMQPWESKQIAAELRKKQMNLDNAQIFLGPRGPLIIVPMMPVRPSAPKISTNGNSL